MARIPRTLTIGADESEALENRSKIDGRPVNELLREAVKSYLPRRDLNGLEGTTSALRAYRKQDPGFKKAIGELVEAEAAFNDPLEGGWSEDQLGPVQRKIRDILDS
jgi:hypothetical protein